MNRTRLTEAFDVAGLPAPEVTVPTGFTHPVRGAVRCPAAPLLAAGLARRGVPVRLAPWPGPLTPAAPTPAPAAAARPAALRAFTTTYLDVDGQVIGLAVVADPALPALVEAAAAELRCWSDALRTRRLLLPVPAPACSPPRHAPGTLVPAREQDHDPTASACRADRTGATVTSYLERGDTVLVLGSGRGAWAERPPRPLPRRPGVVPVLSADHATTVEVPDPAKLSFVQRPCTPVEEFTTILDILRFRFPLLRGQHPDQWCHRPTDTRDAVRSAVAESDLVLLVDGRHPHPWLAHPGLIPVGSITDLYPAVLARAATITLTGPLNRPAAATLSDTLARCLSGLGPLSVIRRRSTSEPATDTHLPPERHAAGALGKP
ncbi:4-hydroxy-3-methylbut-2-enyl diphosphate reductase [Kitasatospora sp. SolWspMP-SS2h]|uniref:hypothetical protein n=1 Tax=Kitasatospora sp. SolWspMP-SS2h TaxID=1305729 RepID=UPI000DBAD58D|nr:hypothetical protein [Kitasatospora sp. SolWspMP-SS2h]RAJ31269.1 4-hydroxy-3-methylbut-2-enyl diphosphate reductase [Kitasatospora sp. SolWspMP-SS2h]